MTTNIPTRRRGKAKRYGLKMRADIFAGLTDTIPVQAHELLLFGPRGAVLMAILREVPEIKQNELAIAMNTTRTTVNQWFRHIRKIAGAQAVEYQYPGWHIISPEETKKLYKAVLEAEKVGGK